MTELRKDSLSFVEALGQSVANVSPTLTPALAVAVVAGMAGSASWLVYVFSTVALLIVGINIGKLAGKIPAAGSSSSMYRGVLARPTVCSRVGRCWPLTSSPPWR
jgi:amino acid transporter